MEKGLWSYVNRREPVPEEGAKETVKRLDLSCRSGTLSYISIKYRVQSNGTIEF